MKRERHRDRDVDPPGLELRRSRIGLALAFAGLVLVLLAIASLTVLPSALIDESAYRAAATGQIDRAELETAENELSRTLLQGVAALGLGATAIVTWWRIRLSEFEVGAGAQAQLAERFSRALEHLASDSPVVRIGGVYALERIAQQSAYDEKPIVRILLGFATERSRAIREVPLGGSTGDIEAAILAVTRSAVTGSATEWLNLAGLHLPAADLSWSINLAWANLAGATFTGARLAGANLAHADLTGANLQDADLANVDMPFCNLSRAEASRIHVLDADMRYLQAHQAKLNDCFFGDVILYRARFDAAKLDGTKLFGLDLSDSIFHGASLRGATIGNCWLANADFTGADLTNVTWTDAGGTANAWNPASPPRFPSGYPEPPMTAEFWGTGPPPRDDF